jgi:hypothetical protein
MNLTIAGGILLAGFVMTSGGPGRASKPAGPW